MPTIIVQDQLDSLEADELDRKIITSVDGIRTLLSRMYHGSGWELLGYDSWEAYLRSVGERTRTSAKYLRRITSAGLLEGASGYELGTFREGTLRPINEILSNNKGFTQKSRVEALELAEELAGDISSITAAISQTAAWYIAVCDLVPESGARLIDRMKEGRISPETAYQICNVMLVNQNESLHTILAELSDTLLATALANICRSNGETWTELAGTILMSGTMPAPNGEQISLETATNRDLIEHLNEPLRMQRYSDAVGRTQELRDIVVTAAASMVERHGIVSDGFPITIVGDAEKKLYELLRSGGFLRRGIQIPPR